MDLFNVTAGLGIILIAGIGYMLIDSIIEYRRIKKDIQKTKQSAL